MEKKKTMLEYLRNIYVPHDKMRMYDDLLRFIWESKGFRAIDKSDAHTSGVLVLCIEIKGKGNRATFSGYAVKRCDFGRIGEKYAEAYIYESTTHEGEVCRLLKKSNKVAIIL